MVVRATVVVVTAGRNVIGGSDGVSVTTGRATVVVVTRGAAVVVVARGAAVVVVARGATVVVVVGRTEIGGIDGVSVTTGPATDVVVVAMGRNVIGGIDGIKVITGRATDVELWSHASNVTSRVVLPTAPAVSDAPAVSTKVPGTAELIRPDHVVPFEVFTVRNVPSRSAPTSFTAAPGVAVTVKKNAIGEPAHTGPLAHRRIVRLGSTSVVVRG